MTNYTKPFQQSYTRNPYAFSMGSPSKTMVNSLYESMKPRTYEGDVDIKGNRSMLDRAFDVFLSPLYITAGGVKGMVDGINGEDETDVTPLEGMWNGLKAGNPLGDGFEEGEYSYSRVLEDVGWKPESTVGKVSKFAVGTTLDFLLDPTTYLTGGGSAFLKGTGRVGKTADDVVKVGKKVAEIQKANKVAQLTKQGVSKELAERFATKQFLSSSNPVLKATHMTDDMAKEIIKNTERARMKALKPDELDRYARSFADKYNDLKGIRNARDAGEPITYGMANLPFLSNKKWAQNATVTLSDGKKVREFSDKLGVSKQYSKLRDKVYGSKIGELFSTKSPLKRLADEDPAKLYDTMKFLDITKGKGYDKIMKDRLIHERAKAMDFTPAEAEEMITLLEDKTTWGKIKDTLKFAETKKATDLRKVIGSAIEETQSEIDEVKSLSVQLDAFRSMDVPDVTHSRKIYDGLNDEYRNRLSKIDVEKIADEEEKTRVVDMIREETNKLKKEIAEKENNLKNIEPERVKQLDEQLADMLRPDEIDVEQIAKEVNVDDFYDEYSEVIQTEEEYLEALAKSKERIAKKNEGIENKESKPTDSVKTPEEIELEYKQKIEELQKERAISEEEATKIVDKVRGERNDFKKRIENKEPAPVDDTPTPEEIIELYEKSNVEKEASDLYESKRSELREQKLKSSEFDDGIRKDQVESLNRTIDEELMTMGITKPNQNNKIGLTKKLSQYIYSDADVLNHGLYGKALDDIVEMVKKGDAPEGIRSYIDANPAMYSPHAKEVWRYIADKYGYKSWEEEYWKPINEFTEKVKKGENLTSSERQKIMQLNQLRANRLNDYETYYKRMTPDEFKDMRRKEANQAMMDELNRTIDLDNERRRSTFYDNDRARVDDASGVDRRYADQVDKLNIEELLTDEEKGMIFQDVAYDYVSKQSARAGKNLFRNENIKNALLRGESLERINKVASTMEELLKKNFKRPYSELSSGQKQYLRSLADDHIKHGDKYMAEKLQKAKELAKKEVERRDGLKRMEAIYDSVNEGTTVSFHDGTRLRAGAVKKVRNTEDGTVFDVVVRGETHEISIRDVKKVHTDIKGKLPKEIVMSSEPTKEELKALKLRERELRKAWKERRELRKSYDLREVELEKEYSEMIANQQKLVDELETKKKTSSISDEYAEHDEYANVVQSKEEYEEAVRLSKEKIAKKGKTPFNSDEYERLETGEYVRKGKTDLDIEFEKELDARNQKLEELKVKKRELRKARKDRREARKSWEVEEEETHQFFQDQLKKQEQNIFDLEEKQQRYIDTIESMETITDDSGKLESLQKELDEYEELLRNDDALESWARMYSGSFSTDKLGRKAFKEAGSFEVDDVLEYVNFTKSTKILLDEKASSEKVAKNVRYLRELFNEIGEKEVAIGKLKPEQFEAMMEGYFPHILTEYGAKHIAKNAKDIDLPASLTQDLGYGAKFNPFSKSRTIKDKNVLEINKHFEEALKGKNLFSENIADVYLTRALKHNELMYDNAYMHNMLDMFGKRLDGNKVEEGYKAVANHGNLKEKIYELAKTEAQKARRRGVKITDEVYDNHVKSVLNHLGLDERIMGDLKTPMVELTPKQIEKLAPHGVVRQVNDVIVMKANQARKIQMTKDNNRFLQMYDKFLHFMKLGQTTVMPSFHVRNKMSNMYLNWLDVGYESINKDNQIASTILARAKGNPEEIKKIIDGKKFGYKQLSRPINIENPHPDLAEIINNGQLHWDELYDLALRHGVIDEGFFAQDVGANAGTKGLLNKRFNVPRKLDPTDTENFVLYKKGQEVGTVVENSDRLINFMANLKKGKSINEAVESSHKFLFDYSDLTAFEQNVMKRIFPYYTWLRKNGRLQVSQLIETPGKYRDTAKVLNGIEAVNSREETYDKRYMADFAKDWVQTPFELTNEEGRQEPILWNPNLPFYDINRIPDPTKPFDSLRELFTQTAPQIKIPAELAMNKNVFFDDEIASKNESRLGASASHMANQFALNNAIKGFIDKDGVDRGLHGLNTFSGVKFLSYDYDTFKRMRINQLSEDPSLIDKMDNKLSEGINSVKQGAMGIMKSTGKGLVDGVRGLVGQEPKSPEEYSGSLRPISVESYNNLSDDEKQKYEPPTKELAMAYNREAIELSQKEYEETGKIKKFVWTLLDKFDGVDEDVEVGYVDNVIDGDTFSVKVGDETKKIRMLLVDTPESVGSFSDKPMPYGVEASDKAKSTLLEKDVKLYIRDKDKYGRHLAYVELPDGSDFNKQLIDDGLGRVRYTNDNFPDESSTYDRTDEYFESQQNAYKDGRGIWSIDGYGGNPSEDEDYNIFLDSVRRWLDNN